MTITNFNYEGSYLPGIICNIVVKADLGRSTPQMHHGIYIMGCIWQPFWILQEKVGISSYFWIIRLVNTQYCTVMSDVTSPSHPHMTPPNFNYEDSYLPGVIWNIVAKADLDRSTPNASWDIYHDCVFGSHFGFFKKRWEFPFISE